MLAHVRRLTRRQAAEAFAHVALQQALAQVDELEAELLGYGVGALLDHLVQDEVVLVHERRLAAVQLVHEYAERPPVHRLAVRLGSEYPK